MSDSDAVGGLDAEAIDFMQRDWENRVTIKTLARDYHVSEDVVRHIISLPRRD